MSKDQDLTALPAKNNVRMDAERKLIVELAERVFFNAEKPYLAIENAILVGMGTDMRDGQEFSIWLTSGVRISQLRNIAEWFQMYADELEEEKEDGTT